MSTHNITLLSKFSGTVFRCRKGSFTNVTDEFFGGPDIASMTHPEDDEDEKEEEETADSNIILGKIVEENDTKKTEQE